MNEPHPSLEPDTACNVCGGRGFGPGPNGRLGRRKQPPRCLQCRSLERHRQVRTLYGRLPRGYLADLSVLQLSPDMGVDPRWFGDYEVSEFGGHNSLDLQAIDRSDGRYDAVICNHVLEHVADDRQAIRELDRICRPDGFLQITVPSPYTRERTVDWGYPRADAFGHFRGYGRDIGRLFGSTVPELGTLEAEAFDPVTGQGGYVYFCSREPDLLQEMQRMFSCKTVLY